MFHLPSEPIHLNKLYDDTGLKWSRRDGLWYETGEDEGEKWDDLLVSQGPLYEFRPVSVGEQLDPDRDKDSLPDEIAVVTDGDIVFQLFGEMWCSTTQIVFSDLSAVGSPSYRVVYVSGSPHPGRIFRVPEEPDVDRVWDKYGGVWSKKEKNQWVHDFYSPRSWGYLVSGWGPLSIKMSVKVGDYLKPDIKSEYLPEDIVVITEGHNVYQWFDNEWHSTYSENCKALSDIGDDSLKVIYIP